MSNIHGLRAFSEPRAAARRFATLSFVRHRYPFDALHWLRQKRVDRQATVVGERAALSAQAQRDEARAEAERRSAQQAIDELARSEHVRLNEGLVRAGELELVGDWRKGADAQLKLKAERERQAREVRVTEVAAEAQARRELGAVSNQAKIIDTHRTDWHAERNAARERSEEEAAAETWTASHFPARRG